MHWATTPPGLVTRAISRVPASASRMKAITSEDSATSNVSSVERQVLRGAVAHVGAGVALTVRGGELRRSGSIAATWSSPRRAASSCVSPPGPQPTSSARIPAVTPAASASAIASVGT